MEHKHTYDAKGKQLCCTQQEKIYTNSGVPALLKSEHSKNVDHNHNEYSNQNENHHSKCNDSVVKMFLPAMTSLCLLLIAIAFDNYFPQSWFTGWVRIIWYVIAYIPVGFPVVKEAFTSIGKGEIFSEFLLMSIATIGAFAIGEYPEGVAVMLFYAVGEVFQTLAVKRAKANIKTLLDQRPDEVTILENNQAITVRAENVQIGRYLFNSKQVKN
jgi:Cd2+/Zn2+-exporting ATPase